MKFVITGEKVEGSERSILPEKSQRDNLKELATKGFAKEAVAKTLRYFKAQKNGNECVQATTSLIEYVNKGQEVPKKIPRNSERDFQRFSSWWTVTVLAGTV